MSAVLTASITALCSADHGDNAEAVAAWTRNKTVAGVTAMLANPDQIMFVAERDGAILAVGAVMRDGWVSLNYVLPAARFTGVSSTLLIRLEQTLAELGHVEGRLESTATARAFYASRGWQSDGPQAGGRAVNCFPMHKRLTKN